MQCPFCKEEIHDSAVKCKHCGSMLSASGGSPPYSTYDQVPWYRRNWFAILCFLVFMPALFLVVLTGNVFYKRGGQIRRYSVPARIFLILYSGLATLIVIALLVQSPGGSTRLASADATSAAQAPPSSVASQETAEPSASAGQTPPNAVASREAAGPSAAAAKPTWNTNDPDGTSNGNVDVAMSLIRSGTKPSSFVVGQSASVMKAPWNFYGRLVCANGTVSDAVDYPPGGDESRKFDGADAQIVIADEDGTPMDYLLLGGTGSARPDSPFMLCGYPVGRVDVDNGLGGQTTELLLVGSTSLRPNQSQLTQAGTDALRQALQSYAAAAPQPSEPSTIADDRTPATTFIDGDNNDWTFTPNDHGGVLKSAKATIYLGKSCDASSPELGKGTWNWANRGFWVTFSSPNTQIMFPREEIHLDNSDGCQG